MKKKMILYGLVLMCAFCTACTGSSMNDENLKKEQNQTKSVSDNLDTDETNKEDEGLQEEESTADPYVELLLKDTGKVESVEGSDFEYSIVKISGEETWYVTINKYTGSNSQVVIPETIDGYPVVKLRNSAFEGCSFVTDIQFPDTLRLVLFDDFNGGKVENCFSDTQWFQNLPEGLYYAGKVVVGYKGNVPENTTIEIKEGTVAVAQNAFSSPTCENIVDIVFPESFRYFTWYSISGTSIEELVVKKEWQSYEHAFVYCDSLKKVVLEEGITTMSEAAFSGCEALKEVVLPNTLTEIAAAAFSDCVSLANISLPDKVSVIREKAFCGSGLESVILNNNLSYIKDEAFADCTNLKSLYIPASVSSYGKKVCGFYDEKPMEDFVAYFEKECSFKEHLEKEGIHCEIVSAS